MGKENKEEDKEVEGAVTPTRERNKAKVKLEDFSNIFWFKKKKKEEKHKKAVQT